MDADLLLKVSGTVLFTITSFMLKVFVNKLEIGNSLIQELSTKIAVMIERLNNYDSRITHLENEMRRIRDERE